MIPNRTSDAHAKEVETISARMNQADDRVRQMIRLRSIIGLDSSALLRCELQTARQAPGIQHTVDTSDDILRTVKLIGHGRGVIHDTSRPRMP